MADDAAVLTLYVGPPRGGCYDRLQRLLKALVDRQLIVHYVAAVPPKVASDRLRFHPASGVAGGGSLSAPALLSAAWRAMGVASREGVRSIFCFGSVYAALLSPLRLRRGTRLVTFLRGDVVEEQRSAGASWWRLGLVRAADRLGRVASHRLLAVSRHLLEGKPGTVVPNDAPAAVVRTPREQARAGFGLPAEAPIVGYCGAVVPAKSLETLVDAVASFDAAHLAVLGFGEPPSPYEKTLAGRARTRLTDRWHAEAWKSDAGPFLDATDAFVLPSRSEGSSNVLLEALRRGVPCLGARTPGIVEILATDEMLFPIGDAAGLRASLASLLGDPLQRARLSRLALERAREFTFDWDERAIAALDDGLGGRLSAFRAA